MKNLKFFPKIHPHGTAERLEALMFGPPRVHLGEQGLSNVRGARLAVLIEGEVLADVERAAVVTTARRATAAIRVLPEGSRQDRDQRPSSSAAAKEGSGSR